MNVEDMATKVDEILQKHVDTLAEAEARAAKRADLEVWRQAYNAAITGLCAVSASCRNYEAIGIADEALADFCAKREEMGR